jgi:extracellular factor (EF) 3-hydroxypalmitic acid methyl ester biosynthesis protein
MHEALHLLEELGPETTDWILSAGIERSVASGQTITIEGKDLADVFIILDGLFSVRAMRSDGTVLGTLGPGELVGEISFLEHLPATASVVACEKSRVLCVARADLEHRLKTNIAFAADLYRGLARVVARRLRERTAGLAEDIKNADGINGIEAWRELVAAVEEFKKTLQALGDSPRMNDRGPERDLSNLHRKFDEFCKALKSFTSKTQNKEIIAKAEIILRREFAPYIHLTQLVRRAFVKPRGYAGDFLTISWMYNNLSGGVAPLGPIVDDLFLRRPCCRAVQNRRGLLAEEIRLALENNGGSARVTSLACGPAEEIFDLFRASPDAKLKATLIDIDFEALAFLAERCEKAHLSKSVRLEHGNLVYLATGRQVLALTDQQLVYSSGLIDYFADEFVISLLNWIHKCLAPGGKVILGNFHTGNPDRALMDLVLDWKLIHRTEEDMHRLFKASTFGRSCTEIRYEDEGINLFAACTKA